MKLLNLIKYIFIVVLLFSMASAAVPHRPNEIYFAKNNGQIQAPANMQVKYYVSLPGGLTAYFTKKGVTYVFSKPIMSTPSIDSTDTSLFRVLKNIPQITSYQSWRVDMVMEGSNNNVEIIEENVVNTGFRAYTPNYSGLVTTCRKLTYRNVYNKIDWIIYIDTLNKTLKYDFVVNKQGDYKKIKMKYKGITTAQITTDSSCVVHCGNYHIKEHKPHSYKFEETTSNGINIFSKFILANCATGGDECILSFHLDPYDSENESVVIDPNLSFKTYMNWGTYYGDNFGLGESLEIITDIDVDQETGNYFIVGEKHASSVSPNVGLTNNSVPHLMMFIAGFTKDNETLWPPILVDHVTNDFFSDDALLFSIPKAVFYDKKLYIVNHGKDFSLSVPTCLTPSTADEDIILLVVNTVDYISQGSNALGGTIKCYSRIGGTGNDRPNGIEVSNNKIYICGSTTSNDFPIITATGAFNLPYSSLSQNLTNNFILRIEENNNLYNMTWATYFGGFDIHFVDIFAFNSGFGIAFNSNGYGNNATQTQLFQLPNNFIVNFPNGNILAEYHEFNTAVLLFDNNCQLVNTAKINTDYNSGALIYKVEDYGNDLYINEILTFNPQYGVGNVYPIGNINTNIDDFVNVKAHSVSDMSWGCCFIKLTIDENYKITPSNSEYCGVSMDGQLFELPYASSIYNNNLINGYSCLVGGVTASPNIGVLKNCDYDLNMKEISPIPPANLNLNNFSDTDWKYSNGFIGRIDYPSSTNKPEVKWVSYYGGNDMDAIKGICYDENRNIFHVGGFTRSLCLPLNDPQGSPNTDYFDPTLNESGTVIMDNTWYNDGFVLSFTPNPVEGITTNCPNVPSNCCTANCDTPQDTADNACNCVTPNSNPTPQGE